MPCQAGESSSMSLLLGYLLDLVSPRQECAFAALAILKDRELRAVQSLQLRAIKHGAHLAIGNAHALPQEDGAICGAHGVAGTYPSLR